jgi:hypothetical protein
VTFMYPRLALFSIFAALTLALISSVPQALAQDSNAKKTVAPRQSEKTVGAGDVARGKYLVESVAVCGQCHTPRDSRGELDRSRWLQGAPVPWMPARPDSDWPLNAPRIGGTPPADDADMVKLLTTGIWTNGNRLRFPMPQFRMERGDAEAVVAYLKSVKSSQ